MATKSKKTSFYMSQDGQRLMTLLATRFGISKSAVLEMLIRNEAKRQKIKLSDTEE